MRPPQHMAGRAFQLVERPPQPQGMTDDNMRLWLDILIFLRPAAVHLLPKRQRISERGIHIVKSV